MTVTVAAPAALVLVATPIGNLGDLSPRAAAELADADLIACEDTRRTGRLLSLAGIARRPLLRLDDHTELLRQAEIVARIQRGERVVVVSDAGTPGVSDPGERLVRAVLDAGLSVEVVPGPSAVLAALVGSGLVTARFCFEGFLPRKAGARRHRLAELAAEARTVVLYESPHRLAETLVDLAAAVGPDRQVVVVRELTKLHEQWWRGTAADAAAWAAASTPRGEFVVVVDGAPAPAEPAVDELEVAIASELAGGATVKAAADAVAARTGASRRELYAMAAAQKRSG